MRKIGVALTVILCALILVFSYASWKEKLASAGKSSEQEIVQAEDMDTDAVTVNEERAEVDLEALTAGMDAELQELFSNRKEQGEKVQLLILGSEAMESGEPGYGELLKDALEEAYAGFIETELLPFDGTSEEFLLSNPQLSSGFDVLLLEPFTLKNNGRVEIEVEHEHIGEIFTEIVSAEDDAVLVLHPPQPIYGAQFYRTQVTALEEFAETEEFAYVNHWDEWPSTEDLSLKEYLTEESNPNTTGAATWANALIAYFTGS